jgi:hypothetical protein
MLTFEKRVSRTSAGPECEFKVYVYRHPKSDGKRVQICIRLARSVLDKAGWFVGDTAIPSVDQQTKLWVLSRTSDRSKGYAITSTDRDRNTAVYMKVTVDKSAADSAVPGGSCFCAVTSADSRFITGSF